MAGNIGRGFLAMGSRNQPRDWRGRWTTTGAGRRLGSQRDMMRKNAEGEGHIVYGYLRDKDSPSGKAGSPYYVGISDTSNRPFVPHTRAGGHNVPVPKDARRIRQFGAFPDRQSALRREDQLIEHFGRKGFNDRRGGRPGILLNQAKSADSGGAPKAATAKKYGFTPDQWASLGENQRHLVSKRYRDGKRGADLVSGLAGNARTHKQGTPTGNRQAQMAANKAWGQYGVTQQDWTGLSVSQRASLRQWVQNNPGRSGAEWLRLAQHKQKPFERMGVSKEAWKSMTDKQQRAMKARYRRGKRGADLTDGLL